MPGLFSRIGAAISGSGGDEKLIAHIEEFTDGYVIQSEVPKTLGLSHQEVALFESVLAEQLYRAYCAEHVKRAPVEKALAHFAELRVERRARVGLSGEGLARLEEALGRVAGDLVEIARKKAKIQSGFDSVDGLTESLVSALINTRVPEVKAARRTALH
jgi:hypothetical protein